MQDLTKAIAARASRRGVLKGSAALGLGALATRSNASSLRPRKMRVSSRCSPGGLPRRGEAKALQALFDAYTAANPGVEIVNAAVAGGAGVNAQAVLQTRLQGNQPPDSWQTHVGHELVDRYVVPGYCEPITDLYQSEGWPDVIPAGLVDQSTWESEQYSVPVNVHRGNGFWYNKKVLADNGIEVGDTMSVDQFFAALDTLKAAGVPALALAIRRASRAARCSRTRSWALSDPTPTARCSRAK